MPKSKPRILYVCEICEEVAPEGCGRYDRNDLRVLADGRWICDCCFDDMGPADFGLLPNVEGKYPDKPRWADLSPAPEYVLARAPQSVDVPEELRRLSEAAGPDAWRLGAVYGSNDETIATVGYLVVGDECDVTFDGRLAPERAELAVAAVNFVRALIARSAAQSKESAHD